MDKIKINQLEVFANHGVFPEETKLGQKFLVDLELSIDTRIAGKTDVLSASVDYGGVSHFAVRFMQEHTYQLIEAAAEHLAEAVLLKYPLIQKVRLQIHKPWAPIGLPLTGVTIDITRSWHNVYLSVGSNMGNREQYIRSGMEQLNRVPECHVENISELIETKPYGTVKQEDFLNGCLKLVTLFTPEELLDKLHEIEHNACRQRVVHWGPRTLDIDILMYDDMIMQTQDLVIPHADMANREFVLKPLCEIAPYLTHPVYHKTIQKMLEELNGRKIDEF